MSDKSFAFLFWSFLIETNGKNNYKTIWEVQALTGYFILDILLMFQASQWFWACVYFN